jgi:hypothetical protein
MSAKGSPLTYGGCKLPLAAVGSEFGPTAPLHQDSALFLTTELISAIARCGAAVKAFLGAAEAIPLTEAERADFRPDPPRADRKKMNPPAGLTGRALKNDEMTPKTPACSHDWTASTSNSSLLIGAPLPRPYLSPRTKGCLVAVPQADLPRHPRESGCCELSG